MRCPIDGNELVISDRGGVEIDYCPQCRGVWLDRGELDKIIDRVYTTQQNAAAGAPVENPPAVGMWDNSTPQQAQPPQPHYPQQPNHPQQPHYPQQPPQQHNPQQQNPSNPAAGIVPALGGLIAGMAANKMANQGQHGHGYGHHGHKKHKKKKGWMDDMFDFD